MGRFRDTRAPAGFCFVEFETAAACELCVSHMGRLRLDGVAVRISPDDGFVEGRQFADQSGRAGGSRAPGQGADDPGDWLSEPESEQWRNVRTGVVVKGQPPCFAGLAEPPQFKWERVAGGNGYRHLHTGERVTLRLTPAEFAAKRTKMGPDLQLGAARARARRPAVRGRAEAAARRWW